MEKSLNYVYMFFQFTVSLKEGFKIGFGYILLHRIESKNIELVKEKIVNLIKIENLKYQNLDINILLKFFCEVSKEKVNSLKETEVYIKGLTEKYLKEKVDINDLEELKIQNELVDYKIDDKNLTIIKKFDFNCRIERDIKDCVDLLQIL